MNVVVFSGTTEGRSFSHALAALGAAVTVCVATELGAEEQGCTDGITVRTGRLDAEEMTALLRGAALCVDATHPYAAEATRNIRAAAAAAGVEYHRLLRPASPLPAGSVVLADAARAAAYLADRPGRVLLATGHGLRAGALHWPRRPDRAAADAGRAGGYRRGYVHNGLCRQRCNADFTWQNGYAKGVSRRMNVVVFSGTTEGRSFSHALAALGAAVTVCVATELGAEEQGCTDGITVRTGRLDAEEMTALLRGAALCVDATHPYAAEATRNIRAAAAAAGVEYHRLLRPASPLPAGSVVLADAARAAAYLADRPGRVLLATGAKELPAFAALDPARLYPRVLPTLVGIAACEAAGIPHRNILAMQGPFTKELNAALLHQFHIDYMVTKDGGAEGGFAEKAEAAARCGVQLIVLRRPDDAGETADTILQRCRELL